MIRRLARHIVRLIFDPWGFHPPGAGEAQPDYWVSADRYREERDARAKAQRERDGWREHARQSDNLAENVLAELAKAQEALRGLVTAVERSPYRIGRRGLSRDERTALEIARATLPDEGRKCPTCGGPPEDRYFRDHGDGPPSICRDAFHPDEGSTDA